MGLEDQALVDAKSSSKTVQNVRFISEEFFRRPQKIRFDIRAIPVEDRCDEPLDPGPCHYFQVKWYWNDTDQKCKQFHYGGCLGSQNRFDSKLQCINHCIYKLQNPVIMPKVCLLDADPGYCKDNRQGHWWYYFNAMDGDCQKFFFYGCGGNNNRFYSLYQCRKVCGERLAPSIACDRCDIRTSVCTMHSKYNYTCDCREGFSRNVFDECVDIDECRSNVTLCDRNAWCVNTVGSYACKCNVGYRGDGKKCTYVGIGRATTDCAKCSPHASCSQGICTCNIGFKGDGLNCTDVNECLSRPNVCHRRAKCRNVKGSFICDCRPGYAGNGYNCTSTPSACKDSFDRQYNEQCGTGNWRTHYYFDHRSKRCTSFWYDGCSGVSMNIFSDLDTCEVLCEMTSVLKSSIGQLSLPVVLS
uniref:EGF-like domain-containing protein n=1 Tax=Setaria digitata TaxID=48799 RepID=A0A915PFK1_9BILA